MWNLYWHSLKINGWSNDTILGEHGNPDRFEGRNGVRRVV